MKCEFCENEDGKVWFNKRVLCTEHAIPIQITRNRLAIGYPIDMKLLELLPEEFEDILN